MSAYFESERPRNAALTLDDDDDDERRRRRRARRQFFFRNLDRVDAVDFVKKWSKSELAIFEPFKVRKFCVPFFAEFGRSSQDLGESDYDWIKSWDDQLNSPKGGMWIFADRNTGDVLRGTEEMFRVEHRKWFAWNTGNGCDGNKGNICVGNHREELCSRRAM